MTLRARLSHATGPAPARHPPTAPTVPGVPIAIVGMGCRFPQAATLEAYWRLLQTGQDAITPIPDNRRHLAPTGSMSTHHRATPLPQWGGFLEDIADFDAAFFGISPRDARLVDPQHRLVLEVAWDAFEHAGLSVDTLYGSRTGVFIGMMYSEYAAMMTSMAAGLNVYTHTGGLQSGAAGRVSHAFGLRGPSLSLSTAASSSLAAVHLACQSLRSGESHYALAGGVNLLLEPSQTIAFAESQMMAHDGRCKFGDARADGFVRSEGVGLVVLKRLAEAVADHDTIYAVIRGSAMNHDGGYETLYMTPSQSGQEAVLRAAYQDAGVAPSEVYYIEAHGTGTRIGDATELHAIAHVVGAQRLEADPCRVGSVKTNIGHTEAAAGIAGLLKVALALHHQLLPPSLHLEVPTPEIAWQTAPIMVQTTLEAWPTRQGTRVAGVSAFGITGTNVHMVLEGVTVPAATELPHGQGAPYLLPLSAHRPEALTELVTRYRDFLTTTHATAAVPLYHIAHTAAVRRSHQEVRTAIVGASYQAWIQQLDAMLAAAGALAQPQGGDDRQAVPRLLFVFPGQGGQWVGMGRALFLTEPAYRRAVEACDAAIYRHAGWSLVELLMAPPDAIALDHVDVIQPLLFGTQVAIFALWQAWGIVPDAVMGHSMGEIAAACVAGALSIEDAARIVCKRSQLAKTTSGQGGMVVVGLSLTACEAWIRDYREQIGIAVSNSPTATVLSGDVRALQDVVARLEQSAIFCRWIKVDYASHSPHMDALQAPLEAALAGIQPRATTIPMYSTLTGQVVPGTTLDGYYWARNLRHPVLFFQTLTALLQTEPWHILEISPHPSLTSAAQQSFQYVGKRGLTLPSFKRGLPERTSLLDTLGTLYRHGYPVAWQHLYADRVAPVALPPYPWQRQRFWFDEVATSETAASDTVGTGDHMPPPLVRKDVWQSPAAERPVVIERHLRALIAFLLGLPEGDIRLQQPLASVGLDSLMGLVLKHQLEDTLLVMLPAPDEIAGASIAQLARRILGLLEAMQEDAARPLP